MIWVIQNRLGNLHGLISSFWFECSKLEIEHRKTKKILRHQINGLNVVSVLTCVRQALRQVGIYWRILEHG